MPSTPTADAADAYIRDWQRFSRCYEHHWLRLEILARHAGISLTESHLHTLVCEAVMRDGEYIVEEAA